ncbi:MAG: hypothetical protein WB763_10300, partial [Terriglobia bacterium]
MLTPRFYHASSHAAHIDWSQSASWPTPRLEFTALQTRLGKSGYIVSPLAVETVIQEGRGKQAEFKGEAGIELVDDLPWG